jgi:ketopantoate reductase
MQILIVGCGAIGGLFAAALSSVAKVTAFDANAEHVRAIKAQGLRIAGKNPRTAASTPPAIRPPSKAWHFDSSCQIEDDRCSTRPTPVAAGNPTLVTFRTV